MKNSLHHLRQIIWQASLDKIPAKWVWVIKVLRILFLTMKSVVSHRQTLFASSALTYYSLLSITPFIALSIVIARGLGLEHALQEEILTRFPQQREVLLQLLEQAESFVGQVGDNLITAFGLALLLWTAFTILRHLETFFNSIWQVPRLRPFKRQVIDYSAMILISPLFFCLSNGIVVFFTDHVQAVGHLLLYQELVRSASYLFLQLLPFLLTWALLSFFYLFMPNIRVGMRAGIIAGFVATVFYQFLQEIYFFFQANATRYGAMYGSLVGFPLFLIWLHLSWLTVFLGAKLSYAIHHAAAYEDEIKSAVLSHADRKLLSLYIVERCVRALNQKERPLSTVELTNALLIPLSLLRPLLKELLDAQLLKEVIRPPEQEFAYEPARSIETLTLATAIEALDHREGTEVPLPPLPVLDHIRQSLTAFSQLLHGSTHNLLLKNLYKGRSCSDVCAQ